MAPEGTTAVAAPEAPRPQIITGNKAEALIPRNLDELQRVAALMFASGLMPTSIKSKEAVAVAVMAGLEVGLSPMAAVQNIAVINGRPSIWGDAMLALVQSSGLLEDYREDPIKSPSGEVIGFRAMARRKGQGEPIENSFTMDDAKRAKLHGKTGPWSEYPQRMMKLRARAFTLRDGFADVLKGLRSREEEEDVIDVTPATTRAALPPMPGAIVATRDYDAEDARDNAMQCDVTGELPQERTIEDEIHELCEALGKTPPEAAALIALHGKKGTLDSCRDQLLLNLKKKQGGE